MPTDFGKLSAFANPFFDTDKDRCEMWNILVCHDFESFLVADWASMEGDFFADVFCAIDANDSFDPEKWSLSYPTLESYRHAWTRQAEKFKGLQLENTTMRDFLYSSARIVNIEIRDSRALAHKRFDGSARTIDGETITFRFQSMFEMARREGRWGITGFVGYLPLPGTSKS